MENKHQHSKDINSNHIINSRRSGQGIDKAPGEEIAQDDVQLHRKHKKIKNRCRSSKERDSPEDQQL